MYMTMRQRICIYFQREIEETANSSPSAVTETAMGTDVLKSSFFYYKHFLPICTQDRSLQRWS